MSKLLDGVDAIGEVCVLTAEVGKNIFKGPFEWDLIFEQLQRGGLDSWSITILTAVFTGMVMAMQFAIGLEPFGASMYTGKLVSLGIVRELG
ncbi:MAG: ABC transporter permease, partial [Myxococcota bacterium]|nr:ABC transporter permease [Myxococcota bacterium]